MLGVTNLRHGRYAKTAVSSCVVHSVPTEELRPGKPVSIIHHDRMHTSVVRTHPLFFTFLRFLPHRDLIRLHFLHGLDFDPLGLAPDARDDVHRKVIVRTASPDHAGDFLLDSRGVRFLLCRERRLRGLRTLRTFGKTPVRTAADFTRTAFVRPIAGAAAAECAYVRTEPSVLPREFLHYVVCVF